MAAKTQKTDVDPRKFIETIEHKQRKADSEILLPIFEEITGEKAVMWGESIVGFGEYTFTYKSGRSGNWPKTGFAPRKQNMTLYILDGIKDQQEKLALLGKHKTSVSCVYINKLADIDMEVLKDLIKISYDWANEHLD